MPFDSNNAFLPLEEGPIDIQMPNGTGRTIVIPAATRIPTGPDQTAISIQFPEIESSYACTVIIENQVIMPGNGYSWRNGIYLNNCWYATLNNIHIHGAGGYMDRPSMDNGVILEGRSNGVSIHNYRAFGLITALLVVGKSEAPRLVDYEFLACLHGIASLTNQPCPGLVASHGHIRATSAAFLFNNLCQFTIDDCLVYGDNGFGNTATWPFYSALMLGGCFDGTFKDIKIGAVDQSKQMVQPYIMGGDRITQNNVVRLPF